MAESQMTPLLDLEKELTCSICTEVLYQPLTLLDCLHTFCGACLKEWFSWQALSQQRAHPFTCPSCRASVRETRPNATVTTLLDMFIQANPARGKSQEEKEEIAKNYKPGDNIIPTIRRAAHSDDDEEDRRLIEEVREMSLRDSERRRGHRPGPSGQARDRSREARDTEERHRRRRDEDRRRRRGDGLSTDRRERDVSESRSQSRQVEHQSSLRSLLSTSDGQSAMEEEILRQIMDEGLLDGIDLHDLDVAQEDELSERIAEAYRRRHQRQPSPPQAHQSDSNLSNSSTRPANRRHVRSRSVQSDNEGNRHQHPPVSRPHLLEASLQTSNRRRADSEQTRRRTSSNPRNPRTASDDSPRQATRSATDLSNQPQSTRPSRLQRGGLESPRRTTDPERSRTPARGDVRPVDQHGGSGLGSGQITDSPLASTAPSNALRPRAASSQPRSRSGSASRPSSSSSATARPRPTLYAEPSINCDRCGKQNIEYDLHQHCTKCNDGKYNVCLRCFREGKGCLKYSGWGTAHQIHRLQETSAPDAPSQDSLHDLIGQKYLRPPQEAVQAAASPTATVRLTTSDPSKRLQTGAFCDICHEFANSCFWTCDQCNLGDWGFCNRCVNKGKCCNHPLLPVAHKNVFSPGIGTAPPSPAPPRSATLATDLTTPISEASPYRSMSWSASCDICTYPIPPSNTRFHCPQCNDGDYDICTNCYLKLVASGKISKDNGHFGWRRCQRGHRMVVVGFEDADVGQKRVIVRDLVGGHALKDDVENAQGHWSWKEQGPNGQTTASRLRSLSHAPGYTGSSTSSRFPPDGGVGICAIAKWGWFPDENAKDELMFPRGAEVREAEDINGDWLWGCYAGAKGLFPGSYIQATGVVGL